MKGKWSVCLLAAVLAGLLISVVASTSDPLEGYDWVIPASALLGSIVAFFVAKEAYEKRYKPKGKGKVK